MQRVLLELLAPLGRAELSKASFTPTAHAGETARAGRKASPAQVCCHSHGCRVILWAGELRFPAPVGKNTLK